MLLILLTCHLRRRKTNSLLKNRGNVNKSKDLVVIWMPVSKCQTVIQMMKHTNLIDHTNRNMLDLSREAHGRALNVLKQRRTYLFMGMMKNSLWAYYLLPNIIRKFFLKNYSNLHVEILMQIDEISRKFLRRYCFAFKVFVKSVARNRLFQ